MYELSVCVCVVLSRSECLVITRFITSKEWRQVYFVERTTNTNKIYGWEERSYSKKERTGLNQRGKLVSSVWWILCWVRLAVRPSDSVTENRCENNLQLPPPAKQHHQSWQGLQWVAVQSFDCRVLWPFVCFILCMKSCWTPRYIWRCWSYQGVPSFDTELIHVLMIVGHPQLLLTGKTDIAAPILAVLKKLLVVHVLPLFVTKNRRSV